jgi:hypothetical protein
MITDNVPSTPADHKIHRAPGAPQQFPASR